MSSQSKRWAAALAAALSVAPSIARAEGPAQPVAPAAPAAPRDAAGAPSNGSTLGIVGSVLAVGGTASILVLPFCSTLDGTGTAARQCLVGAGTVSAVFLAVGLPLLAVSDGQARAFKAWQSAHPGVAGLGFSAGSGGGTLTWSARF